MYFHDFSPFLVQLTDHFGVQWNGLSYVLGFFFAFIMVRWMTLRQRSGIPVGASVDLVMYSAIGVLVGGRLGYCLFYSPDLFIKFKADFPFWGVLAVGDGGMSAIGGMLGVVAAATIFAIRTGISRLYVYDLVALAAPFGIALGRGANFLHGELIGKQAENSFPFSFKFPTEILQWPMSSPEKLPELASAVQLLPNSVPAEQWNEMVANMNTNPEAHASVIQHIHSILQAVQHGSVEMKNALMPLLVSRHPVQLYGALAEGLFVGFVLLILWFWPRKPGVVSATFLVLFSAMRIVVEHYRMPDPFLGEGVMGLARGQWLSAAALVFGVALLFMWGRRETLPVSGWGQGHSVRIHRR